MRRQIQSCNGPAIVYGTGAALVAPQGKIVYFDMPRWEIQCRFQKGLTNWKTDNAAEEKLRKFKRGFLWNGAWLTAKERAFEKMDYVLDTVIPGSPKW